MRKTLVVTVFALAMTLGASQVSAHENYHEEDDRNDYHQEDYSYNQNNDRKGLISKATDILDHEDNSKWSNDKKEGSWPKYQEMYHENDKSEKWEDKNQNTDWKEEKHEDKSWEDNSRNNHYEEPKHDNNSWGKNDDEWSKNDRSDNDYHWVEELDWKEEKHEDKWSDKNDEKWEEKPDWKKDSNHNNWSHNDSKHEEKPTYTWSMNWNNDNNWSHQNNQADHHQYHQPMPSHDLEFSTTLTGMEEVPPVHTQSTGWAEFKVVKNEKHETVVWYEVKVWNGMNVTAAHIHNNNRGQNGPVVVDLFHSMQPVDVNGSLVRGYITQSDLKNDGGVLTLIQLADMMKRGQLYVNVHTVDYPNGEIRGQIA